MPTFRWTREELEKVRPISGLYDVRGYIPRDKMYHGMAKNLRTRLFHHFRASDIGFFPAVVIVTYEGSETRRKELEKKRIRRDRPRYNKRVG